MLLISGYLQCRKMDARRQNPCREKGLSPLATWHRIISFTKIVLVFLHNGISPKILLKIPFLQNMVVSKHRYIIFLIFAQG